MTWKTNFEFRILVLFRVPRGTRGHGRGGWWYDNVCNGVLGHLADLAQTCFNLINILSFLFSPRPLWPKGKEGIITQH